MGEMAAAAKQGPGQGPGTLAPGNRLGGGVAAETPPAALPLQLTDGCHASGM